MKSFIFGLILSFAVSANAHSQLSCPIADGEFNHISGLKFRVAASIGDSGHYEAFLNGKWTNAYVGSVGKSKNLFLGSVIDDLQAEYEICGEVNSDGLSIAQIRKLN